MAIIPLLRTIVFSFATLSSLVVLGICAHLEYLVSGYDDVFLTFAAFGIAAASVTIVTLPLFLFLGRIRRGIFTSMIIFEIVWFFILWVLWVGTAGDTVAGRAFYFPEGCIYSDYATTNSICYEFTVVEAFAFLNFFCVFIYYDILLLYAIINAIRGKGIWTASVQEAVVITSGTGNPNTGIPMNQTPYNVVPGGQFPNYAGFPQNAPPQAYPQQSPYPQQGPPMSQNQAYYPPSPGTAPQQPNYGGYSPNGPPGNSAPLPPQPNYNSYPAANGSQGQLPLPSGYQQPQPQSPYGSHQPIPV
ncbi:hypothetical protein HYDPIDRAFT_77279 [Hydnomerulius pinastri MD-312]|nr:hypothetical protein HYDPIDRAFT_77279 [Hydnomerulius pinastri MD-312]